MTDVGTKNILSYAFSAEQTAVDSLFGPKDLRDKEVQADIVPHVEKLISNKMIKTDFYTNPAKTKTWGTIFVPYIEHLEYLVICSTGDVNLHLQ